ncbi:MAG: acyltransferase, partial [Bacteroidales bacterium]|nr:acyltransferase [Bacteroidales bacterium]
LKMFSLSGNSDFVESMDELKINPVAVSYEYDPCDFLKAAEMYVSTYQKYMKSKNEDMNSIMKGFLQFKGNVEFVVTKPITREELKYCDSFEKNEKFTHLAEIIDQRIYSNYRLFKTNFIAHDILSASQRFADRYTADEKNAFEDYMRSGIAALEFPHHEEIENFFLHIYANPVDNCLKYQQ